MKIYVSLPITGYSLSERKKRAKIIKEKIQKLGHEAVTPFDMCDDPSDHTDMSDKEFYAYCMGHCITGLLKCDAVYYDDNWHQSKGCRAESSIAQIYSIPCFYLISDINPE